MFHASPNDVIPETNTLMDILIKIKTRNGHYIVKIEIKVSIKDTDEKKKKKKK